MNDEADLLAELEKANTERGEAIAGSYLRRFVCTVCLERVTLATAEHAVDAVCGPCLAERTGGGGSPGSVPLRPVIGYPVGTDTRVPAVREAHPAPLVSSRDGVVGGVEPGPVSELAQMAAEAGWRVIVQYARGRGVHGSTGRPTALVESWAVRAYRIGQFPGESRIGVAVYVGGAGNWTWKSVWIISSDRPPFGKAGVTELKQWLAAGGDLGTEWSTEIAEKKARAEARAKQRVACDRGAHADANVLMTNVGKMYSCPHCGNSWKVTAQPWRKPKKAKEGAS